MLKDSAKLDRGKVSCIQCVGNLFGRGKVIHHLEEREMLRYMCLFIVLSNPEGILAQNASDVPIVEVTVTENVVLYKTGETNAYPNMIALKTQKGVVVFDTHAITQVAERIRVMIGRRFGGKIAYVISTHGWYDHTNGNIVFKGIPVIAHDQAAVEMTMLLGESRNPVIEQELGKRVTELTKFKDQYAGNPKDVDEAIEVTKAKREARNMAGNMPSIQFSDRMTLDMGSVTMRLYYNTPSYSTSDIIIEIPEEKVLVVGDIFNKGRLPWLDRETDFASMQNLFARFVSDSSHIRHFIGTHGYLIDMNEMREQLQYINKLREDVTALRRDGRTLEEIRNKLDLKALPFLNSYNPYVNGTDLNLHHLNIRTIWRMLGG
ncbi:MAG: MBL fold metallo-hydrolase [Bacteroidota bacterium]